MPEPTSTGAAVTAAVVKVGIATVQQTAPRFWTYLKAQLKGKRILIVGQPRAGKTTLVDYLQYQTFEDEKETDKTHDPKRTGYFELQIGHQQRLKLIIKNVVDLPGQTGPVDHANLAFKHSPDGILILMDLTSPKTGERACGKWLTDFCERLEEKWRASGKSNRRLKSMIIVLNKRDKSDDKRVDKQKKALRKIVDEHFRQGRGAMLATVKVMPCILVTNPDGTKFVDSIISTIARELVK